MSLKKTILPILLLAAGPLAIGAGAATAVLAADASETPSSSAIDPYAITYADDISYDIDFVTRPTSALPGEKVELTLSYSPTYVYVEEVRANGILAAMTGDYSYAFEMPAEAVEISIVSHSYDPTYRYNVYLLNDEKEGVSIQGEMDYIAAWDEVSLTIGFEPDSGYTFKDSLSLYIRDEHDEKKSVEYTLANNVLTFEMPESNVYLLLDTEVRGFLLSKDTSDSNISSVKYGTSSVWSSAAYVKYGEEVTVTLKDTNARKATGIVLEGTDLTYALPDDSEDMKITFSMPAHDVKVVSTYEQIYKTVTLAPSDHISLEIGTYDADAQTWTAAESLSIGVDTKTYLKVTPASDAYAVDSLTATYSTSSKLTLTSVTDGIYSFTMPAYDVSIAVTELEAKYKDAAFVGTYQGANVYSTTVTTSFSASYSLSIDEFGRVIKGSGTSYTHTVAAADETNKLISLKSATSSSSTAKDAAYGTNVIIGHYNFGSSFGTDSVNDFIVAWKTGQDASANWSMRGIRFGASSYMLSVLLKDGAFFDAAFVDISAKKAYTDGVTISYDEGYSDINDSGASYTILLDGIESYKVTGKTTISAVTAE